MFFDNFFLLTQMFDPRLKRLDGLSCGWVGFLPAFQEERDELNVSSLRLLFFQLRKLFPEDEKLEKFL
jgi:hypothetical protein